MQTTPTFVTITETVTECDTDPLVPVTCTVNVPVELAPIVRIAVPEPLTLVGLTAAPMPGEWLTVRETTPLNPLSAVTVMVEVPEEPREMVRLVALAAMENPCWELLTVNDTTVE